MKVEVMEEKRIKKTVEIDFPYYYEHDMLLDRDDCIMYGVYISPDLGYSITITVHGNDKEEYNIEIDFGICNSYLQERHKSTKEAFNEALNKVDGMANRIRHSLNIEKYNRNQET